MSYQDTLIQKINSKEATIGVIGIGYVGLPLVVEFAQEGFRVLAVDVDPRKVDLLNAGESYIGDIASEEIAPLVEAGLVQATTDYAALAEADAISICVPTPLRQTKDPDMSFVISAIDELAKHAAHAGTVIILESTTYPGTTEEIILPRLANDGYTVGEDVFIAFSPERIDPGNKTYKLRNTPKVIGGITPACTQVAVTLYSHVVDNPVPVSSPTVAEMVKLLENTFRAVNIGLVNEVALICDRLGVNVWEVINAAKTKPFGFMPFYPGPGLGGHCIPVDPHYLSWKLKTLNYTARFIELASEVNTSMPLHVIDKVVNGLNDARKPIRDSRIVVLGVAYKPNVNDVRESPALDVIELLLQRGGDVVYHDPYVPQIRLENGEMMQSVAYSDTLLSDADCVVIVTNHQDYDWQHVLDHSQLVVDTRNATADYETKTPVVSI